MALTNETFVQMEHFGVLTNSVEKTLKSLANLTEMGDTLKELQNMMSSDVMKVAIKSLGGGNFEGNYLCFKLQVSFKKISLKIALK